MADTPSQPTRGPAFLIGGALVSTFLIERAEDVSLWIKCGMADRVRDVVHYGGKCKVDTEFRIVGENTGLAVGSLLAILVAALAARRREKPVNEALAAVIGVLVVSLFGLIDNAEGERHVIEWDLATVPLFIWLTVALPILMPLFAFRGSATLDEVLEIYLRLALACLLGAAGGGIIDLASQVLQPPPSGQRLHFMVPYAVVAGAATWATLASRLAERSLSWAIGSLILALVLVSAYGASRGYASGANHLKIQSNGEWSPVDYARLRGAATSTLSVLPPLLLSAAALWPAWAGWLSQRALHIFLTALIVILSALVLTKQLVAPEWPPFGTPAYRLLMVIIAIANAAAALAAALGAWNLSNWISRRHGHQFLNAHPPT